MESIFPDCMNVRNFDSDVMMRLLGMILCAGMTVLPLVGEEQPVPAKGKGFDVASVIAAPVAKLGTPQIWLGSGEVMLPVSSSSAQARGHVQQGFALVHSAWDFEAYRHFAAALKADPDCLLAYCGVAMSLLNPSGEFRKERAAALDRMLALAGAQRKVDGKMQYVYPEIERGYAAAIGELMLNGVARGAAGFQALSYRYPKDLQAKMLAAYLARDGYTSHGARPAQKVALAVLHKIIEENPDNPLPLNFLLMMQTDAPDAAVDIKNDLLPMAKLLIEKSWNRIPERQSLLGHYAWRCGDLDGAQKAFEQAVGFYQSWQDEDGVSDADMANALRAQVYLVAVLHAKGEYEAALDRCSKLMAMKIPVDRAQSDAAMVLRWQASLMPCKMYLERGGVDNLANALKSLPVLTANETAKQPYFALTLSAYRFYIEGLQQCSAGKKTKARELHAKLMEVLQKMQALRPKVAQETCFADFLRAIQTLNIHQLELAARASDVGLGYNWLSAAVDAQILGSRQLPPDILYPIEYHLGRFLLESGDKEGARTAFANAVRRRPSHLPSKLALEQLSGTSD